MSCLKLRYWTVGANLLTELGVSGMQDLETLNVSSNFIEQIDCSDTGVSQLICNDNPLLKSIYIKNNTISFADPDLLYYGFDFHNLPMLEFICMDSGDLEALEESGYGEFNNNVIVSTESCELALPGHVKQSVTLYPNPVNEASFLNSTEDLKEFFVYDISGRKIHYSGNKEITLSSIGKLSSGSYILQVLTGNGIIRNIRFIKS